jgi:hypothetical protein
VQGRRVAAVPDEEREDRAEEGTAEVGDEAMRW